MGRLFAASRQSAEDPLTAAKAYENTKKAIIEAKAAAQNATKSANKAHDQVG